MAQKFRTSYQFQPYSPLDGNPNFDYRLSPETENIMDRVQGVDPNFSSRLSAPTLSPYGKDSPFGDPALQEQGQRNVSMMNEASESGAEDVTEKTGEKGNWGAAATAAKGVATEKSAAGKAGSGLMAAGMATSDPYLVAAGAGLSAVGAVQDQKNERKANQMQKRNDRRQQIIAALGGFRNAVV